MNLSYVNIYIYNNTLYFDVAIYNKILKKKYIQFRWRNATLNESIATTTNHRVSRSAHLP